MQNRLIQNNRCYSADRSIDLRFVILHHIQATSFDEALVMLLENGVSAHYVVDYEGEVFKLVEEFDTAYHAGMSYWNGYEGLNGNSIGIEMLSHDPYKVGFSERQLDKVGELVLNIIQRNNINKQNILGHFEVAYNKEDGLLGRKDDPSFLFDWGGFYEKFGLGIWYNESLAKNTNIITKFGDKFDKISEIQKKLLDFGYRISITGLYDIQMQKCVKVFHHKFYPKKLEFNGELWDNASDEILNDILKSKT